MPLLNDLDIDRPARRRSVPLGGVMFGVKIEARLGLSAQYLVGPSRRRLDELRLGDLGKRGEDVLKSRGAALLVRRRPILDLLERPEKHWQRLPAPRSVYRHP